MYNKVVYCLNTDNYWGPKKVVPDNFPNLDFKEWPMFLGLLISRGDIELPVRSTDLTQYEYFVGLLQGTEVFKRHP